MSTAGSGAITNNFDRVMAAVSSSSDTGSSALPLQYNPSNRGLLVHIAGDGVGIGGGTQYTEGDTDTTITGTAIMWEDSSDTLRSVSAAKPLPVTVSQLSAAAALTDAFSNPTTTQVGSMLMGWSGASWDRLFAYAPADNANSDRGLLTNSRLQVYDGANWDMLRGDSTNGALVNLGANNDVSLNSGTNAIGKLVPMDQDTTANTNHAQKYYTNAGAVTDGIVWSPAAGKRWHILTLYINVSAAATVTLEDDLVAGDSAVWKGELAANSGVILTYDRDHPFASGEDAADLIITTSAGNVYVQAVGYEI